MLIHDQKTFAEDQKSILATLASPQKTVLNVDGLIAGTRVETATGWRDIAMLASGDQVYTYDGGLRRVEKVERCYFELSDPASAHDFLVHIPGGVLDTCSPVQVLASQDILLESPVLDDLLGVSAGLAKASDLIGLAGISPRRPTGILQSVRPLFGDEEIIWANTGLMCHLPAAGTGAGVVQDTDATGFFTRLSRGQTRAAACEMFLGRGLGPAALAA